MSSNKPKIAIVGAGAMGGLFGALLTEGGLDVILIDTAQDHIEAIKRHGIRLVGYGGDRQVPLQATADASTLKAADIVFFQCKAYANEAAARSVKHLFNGHTVGISFQNGLGNEEVLAHALGANSVLGGLTTQAGLVEAPGVVRNFGHLPSLIGEMTGGVSKRAEQIASLLTRYNLPTQASPDIKRDKWKKLLGNVGLGALSAATDLTSAQIMAVPELRDIVLRAIDEAARVASTCGVSLNSEEKLEVLKKITDTSGGGTGSSKSSMAADIARRRRTEIDTIHGSVARLGRQYAVPTPTIDTMIAVVKGLESRYLNSGSS